MSCLDNNVTTEIMKRLPARIRPDVTIRLAQPALRNQPLLEQIARAVVGKAEKLVDSVPELTSADRDKNVATMLRALNRTERKEIMDALQISDADTAARVGALLFQFEDILRVEDRGLQAILIELDMKTLAMALKGAADNLVSKISTNISSRARDMLNEEMGLLGAIPSSRVQESRNKIVALLRQFEEEGKIVLLEE
jgi:flagellar motor switch protein FliG